MKTTTIIIAFLLSFTIPSSGQSAIYGEFAGANGIYSINYDQRFQDSKFGLRVGIGYLEGFFGFPIHLNFVDGKHPHFLEITGGPTVIVEGDLRDRESAIIPTVFVKYRYQKREKGLFFNIGPGYIVDIDFWFGVGLGYSF